MATAKERPAYLTWGDGDARGRALALAEVGSALEKVRPVCRTQGSDLWVNVLPNVSVRDGFNRRDYEAFRPEEAVPKKPRDVILACMRAYERHGVVRNTIDLMADFATQGMTLAHPNERVERFYKEWFRKVGGPERSERFVNTVLRCGMVLSRRHTAKLTVGDEEALKRGTAAEVDFPRGPRARSREIPARYTFLSPLSVRLLSDTLAPFVGPDGFLFGVQIPSEVIRAVKEPRGPGQKALVGLLPRDVVAAIRAGETVLPLPADKTSAYFYKRDDWNSYALPMTASVLPQLNMLEKMQLADLAALDGVISTIRVWKLGSLEHKIMPSEATILRLATMLTNNVGGGVMDLVWGPDVELVETSTEAHRFLGQAKYEPVLGAINQGLGVPAAATPESSSKGFTSDYFSLKVMVERLEYCRAMLKSFWEEEARLVQRAMDFRFPAVLTFDRVLTDEAAEKQLLLNMADRGLISDETLQERFGLVPEIEEVRSRREARRREQGLRQPKAGPFHDANHVEGMKKIFAQSGAYAPSELGVELDEKKAGEKPPVTIQAKAAPKPAPGAEGALPGQPGQGRPRNSKDRQKRKKREQKPRGVAFLAAFAAAERRQADIAAWLVPLYLKARGKKTARELTDDEANGLESLRFGLLFRPLTAPLGPELLRGDCAAPAEARALVERALAKVAGPTVETTRKLQSVAHALLATGASGDPEPALPRAGEEPAAGAGAGGA